MNVKQVSGYLHLNEKKIYALVNKGHIPATRVTGKWMFPKELIDKWMLDSTHNGLLHDRLIIAGSDDPFLHRIINEFTESLGNRAIITYTPTATRTGLELLNANKVLEGDGGLVPRTEIEKQRLHVEASMSRCRRCGDFAPAFPVAGILLRLCSDCETHLQKRDGVMWFAHMVAAISQKGKKS